MLWLTIIEWLARLILLILVGLSVWSVSIMIERKRFYKSIHLPTDEYRKKIKSHEALTQDDTIVGRMIREIAHLKNSEKVNSAFESFVIQEKKNLENGLAILGTLGSTTPFIGLLGTILGIIVSFGELSQGSAGTNAVMNSLAEALILTAVGLIVAIPAVIAFNFFSKKARGVLAEVTALKELYLAYKE